MHVRKLQAQGLKEGVLEQHPGSRPHGRVMCDAQLNQAPQLITAHTGQGLGGDALKGQGGGEGGCVEVWGVTDGHSRQSSPGQPTAAPQWWAPPCCEWPPPWPSGG